MRGLLLGSCLSLSFVVGCTPSSTPYGVHSAQAEPAQEQRWSYFCFAASDADDVSSKANAAGMHGWAMVAANTARDGQAVWCFRRPRP